MLFFLDFVMLVTFEIYLLILNKYLFLYLVSYLFNYSFKIRPPWCISFRPHKTWSAHGTNDWKCDRGTQPSTWWQSGWASGWVGARGPRGNIQRLMEEIGMWGRRLERRQKSNDAELCLLPFTRERRIYVDAALNKQGGFQYYLPLLTLQNDHSDLFLKQPWRWTLKPRLPWTQGKKHSPQAEDLWYLLGWNRQTISTAGKAFTLARTSCTQY